jgi:hypothetical protein
VSRKHNTKHAWRGQSHYPERLQARGLTSRSVRMLDLESLRKRQGAPEDTGHMNIAAWPAYQRAANANR